MAKIMAVDDQEEILAIVRFKLQKSGHEVEIQSDPVKALPRMKEFKPDLVFLDIMMPKITGLEICSAMKSDPDLSDIKIVFLTAKDMDFARQKAKEVGGDAFIAKPFALNELTDTVDRLLNH